jgi:hypothetical protein
MLKDSYVVQVLHSAFEPLQMTRNVDTPLYINGLLESTSLKMVAALDMPSRRSAGWIIRR